MKQIVITCMMFLLIGTSSTFGQEEDRERSGERMEQHQQKRKHRQERMKSLKIAYMTEQLELTPSESEKFWPIYNQYDAQIQALKKENRGAKKPEEMTEAEAEVYINKRLQIEEEKIAIKRNLARDVKPIIGSKRVIVMAESESRFRKKVLKKAGKRKDKHKSKRKMGKEKFKNNK